MLVPKNRKPTLPGEFLREIIEANRLTQGQAAQRLQVSRSFLNAILQGASHVTPQMALRLAKFTGLDESFWLNAQQAVSLWEAKKTLGKKLEEITPLATA